VFPLRCLPNCTDFCCYQRFGSKSPQIRGVWLPLVIEQLHARWQAGDWLWSRVSKLNGRAIIGCAFLVWLNLRLHLKQSWFTNSSTGLLDDYLCQQPKISSTYYVIREVAARTNVNSTSKSLPAVLLLSGIILVWGHNLWFILMCFKLLSSSLI